MRTTGNGFLFIVPVRVRADVISYTWRLLIFKSVASSSTVKISIALTLATPPRIPNGLERTLVRLCQGRHQVQRCGRSTLPSSTSHIPARATMLSNLTHSFCNVQQLFVRVIFLPGISDSSKPIRHLTFRRANRFADVDPPLQTRRIKQTTTFSSASSAGTWALICGERDYGPATTTASQGGLIRRLPCTGVRVRICQINCLLRRIPYRKHRAAHRDLLGRDTMFACYSSQE
jgi:hypothetical protein